MGLQTRWFLMALAAATLFGISTPASKMLLGHVGPIWLAALYYLGAALCLLPFSLRHFKREVLALRRNPADLRRMAGAVLFGGILGPLFLLFGIREAEATTASLLLNLETVATAVLAWAFFRESVGGRASLSALLTLTAGGLLVIKPDLSFNMGGILIAMACVCWGMDNNLTATVEAISPQTNTIVKGLGAGSFNLVLALLLEGTADLGWSTTALALGVGGLAYGASIALYIGAARHMGATRSQIVFATNPFIGGLVAFWLFHDAITIQFVFATILMIVAVALLCFERHSHEHLHSDEEHEHEHSHDDEHHEHSHSDLQQEVRHTHRHRHQSLRHRHLHFPDVHHRHEHS